MIESVGSAWKLAEALLLLACFMRVLLMLLLLAERLSLVRELRRLVSVLESCWEPLKLRGDAVPGRSWLKTECWWLGCGVLVVDGYFVWIGGGEFEELL